VTTLGIGPKEHCAQLLGTPPGAWATERSFCLLHRLENFVAMNVQTVYPTVSHIDRVT